MANARRTTIPQFSLRALLLAVTVMAVVLRAVSRPCAGTAWVGGVAVGFAALAVAFAVYVTMFAFVAFCTALDWTKSGSIYGNYGDAASFH